MKNTQILIVANQKRGTVKISTTHNLGKVLALQGEKNLILDL